jgi:hypothetical protein
MVLLYYPARGEIYNIKLFVSRNLLRGWKEVIERKKNDAEERILPLGQTAKVVQRFPRREPDNDTDDHEGGRNYTALLVALSLFATPIVLVGLVWWAVT